MFKHCKTAAFVALAMGLTAGPAGADVMPAAAYDPGLVGVVPSVFAFLAWGPVLLLVLWASAGLLWFIEADRRKDRRNAGPQAPRTAGSVPEQTLLRRAA